MDKILFQGQVTDLFAEDYQYLQDNLENETKTVFLQTIDYLTSSVIVSGFILAADIDTTKIKVWHNNEAGSFATSTGVLFYTTEEFHNNILADETLGALNYVCAIYYTTTGTYNKQTGLIEEGVAKAIDYESYTYNYNRQISKCRIAIYTASQYAAITPKTNVILLGVAYGAGIGQPITVIDLSVRTYAKTRIIEGSIRLEHLDPSFMLPQRMIYPTSTGDIDDEYYLTPVDIKDDLNKVRTQIKNIKNTPNWDDFLTGIQATDPDMNELHRSGVFPNAHSIFTYELEGGGTAVKIKSGKILINRDVKEFSVDTPTGIAVTPGDTFYIGDYTARTGAENHFAPPVQPFDFNLTYFPLLDIHIVNNALPLGPEYIEGFDYTVNYGTGAVNIPIGSNIFNKTLNCYYRSGIYRCDMIAINTAGYHYFEGTPDATEPQPPAITSSGLVPLYYLYRKPMQDYIEDADVVSCRLYTEPVKEVRDILCTSLASYTSTGVFNATHTYGVHKLAFSSTSTGTVLPQGSGWSITSTGTYPYITLNQDKYCDTIIYTQLNDELWINVFPQTVGGVTIDFNYESIQGSDIFDQTVTIDIPVEKYIADVPVLINVTKGFLEGYHKLRFFTSTGTSFKFNKLVVGKSNFYEHRDKIYVENAFTGQLETRAFNSQWITGYDYIINSIINEDHNWYKCLINHTSSSFLNDYSAGYWEKVGANREDFENLIIEKNLLQDRVIAEEQTNLNQELRIEYLEGKTSINSKMFTDLFMNHDVVDTDYETSSNYPADIQDNNDWNNNWKERDSGTAFKNGYMRPRRYFFMMEPREYYNLDDVGQFYKQAISRYDTVNSCYWFLTTGANTAGQIVRLDKHFSANSVTVLGKWDLPIPPASCSWLGIDVDTTGTFLYIAMRGNPTVTANALYKIKISTSATLGITLGLGNRTSSECISIDNTAIAGCTTIHLSPIITMPAATIQYVRIGMAVYHAVDFIVPTYVVSIDSDIQITVSAPAATGAAGRTITFFDYSARVNSDSAANQLYTDCTIWDAANTDIGIIKTTNSGANRPFGIFFYKTAENASWPRALQTSTLNTITMNTSIIGTGGTNEYTRSMIKDHVNNILWFKLNDRTTDMRWIYRINLTTDIPTAAPNAYTQVASSGRFRCTRGFDEDGNTGITLSNEGDLLEVVSTASNGKFLSKRALKNALWAENQVSGLVSTSGSRLGAPIPNVPTACMVESSSYYWTGDVTTGAPNMLDIYRYSTITNDYKSVRLSPIAAQSVVDMCTNGTTMWILLYTPGPLFNIYYGPLATFIAAMSNNVNPGANLNLPGLPGWAAVAGGIIVANVKYSICWDGDASLVYVLNTSTLKIDTLTAAGVYTAGVYALPATTSSWTGLAYKNGKIFIRDVSGAAQPNRIYVMDKSLSTATAWYVFHIYQDPAETFTASGSRGMDFDGKDLVSVNQSYNGNFYKQKTLEDPTCLQLHTFILASTSDAGGTYNTSSVLLTGRPISITPITERYFEPEEFANKEDIPDKYYMGVTYANQGFTLLHLDEYLSDVSVSGIPRFDARKIRVQHYKRGVAVTGSAPTAAGYNIAGHAASYIRCMVIEKDMIITNGDTTAVNSPEVIVIDLKSGKATILWNSGGVFSGLTYQGSLSLRNSGLSYQGINNTELDVTVGTALIKMCTRTFFKEDDSDYNGVNPKTFVILPTAGGIDLLVIDWDNNGNRTLAKVWNNVFNNASSFSCFLAKSGKLFAANTADVNGAIGAINGKKYIWEVDKDAIGNTAIGTNIGGSYVLYISNNSPCWKTAAGTWRHILYIATGESGVTGIRILRLVDVENLTTEDIMNYYDGNSANTSIDNYEDVVLSNYFGGAGNTCAVQLWKKQRFNDKLDTTSILNGWTAFSLNGFLNSTDRPIFTLGIPVTALFIGAVTNLCINPGQNLFAASYYATAANYLDGGVQFMHVAWTDSSLYQTKTFDIDNPREVHYLQHSKID